MPEHGRMEAKRRRVETSIRMDVETWLMLGELARLRALRLGGQKSQSAVIRDLIHDAGAAEALPGSTPTAAGGPEKARS